MARLFIFGNGYDGARLSDNPTSYLKFKEYLEEKYNTNSLSYSDVQNCSAIGESVFKLFPISKRKLRKEEKKRKKAAAYYLYSFLEFLCVKDNNNHWSTFENALGKLPIDEIISSNIKFNKQKNIELENCLGSPFSHVYDLITSLSPEIHMLFAEWINSIPIKNVTKGPFETEIIKDIEPSDIFISFNYTKTLEKLFNETSTLVVNHLHGIANSSESIIVGHRNKEIHFDNDPEEYKKLMIESLKKPVEHVIETNEILWSKIKVSFSTDDHNKIYEFGWSCSPEDEEYIAKIINIIPSEKVDLYLNNYEDEAKAKYNKWRDLGYKGNAFSYIEQDNKIELNKFNY